MPTGRLEAFSDGVMAIIITITVLGVRVPDTASLAGLMSVAPVLAIYAWSFQMVGTYWNNHHHLLRRANRVTSTIMWANLHLLFWLSLVPFVTEWLGRHPAMPWPTAVYAAVLLMSALAYEVLQWAIRTSEGADSDFARALGHGWKDTISVTLYASAVAMAFVYPWASYGLVVLVSAVWFIPDRRMRRAEA